MLAAKQHDYGPENILAFNELGLVVRLNDKLARLENLQRRVDTGLAADALNEAVADTWLDLVGYAAIALMLDAGTFGLPLEADWLAQQERSRSIDSATPAEWDRATKDLRQKEIAAHEQFTRIHQKIYGGQNGNSVRVDADRNEQNNSVPWTDSLPTGRSTDGWPSTEDVENSDAELEALLAEEAEIQARYDKDRADRDELERAKESGKKVKKWRDPVAPWSTHFDSAKTAALRELIVDTVTAGSKANEWVRKVIAEEADVQAHKRRQPYPVGGRNYGKDAWINAAGGYPPFAQWPGDAVIADATGSAANRSNGKAHTSAANNGAAPCPDVQGRDQR